MYIASPTTHPLKIPPNLYFLHFWLKERCRRPPPSLGYAPQWRTKICVKATMPAETVIADKQVIIEPMFKSIQIIYIFNSFGAIYVLPPKTLGLSPQLPACKISCRSLCLLTVCLLYVGRKNSSVITHKRLTSTFP